MALSQSSSLTNCSIANLYIPPLDWCHCNKSHCKLFMSLVYGFNVMSDQCKFTNQQAKMH